MVTPNTLCGILLAAGSASRFGGGKLVHALPDSGEAIALRAWRNLCKALPCVCVVVRAGDNATLTLFRNHQARVVICDDAAQGMGHSLACGVRANAYSDGWIIALGDMPFVQPQTIGMVADAISQDAVSIAIPTYQGKRGHPVGFRAEHFGALCGLYGDAGARTVLRAHATAIREVATDDAGILTDIDQREDLLKLGNTAR